MLRVIGKKDCSRCDIVVGALKDKNVEFEYEKLEELEEEEKKRVLKLAMLAGNMEMPIMIRDGKAIGIRDIL